MITRQKDLLYVYWTRGVIYMNNIKKKSAKTKPKHELTKKQLDELIQTLFGSEEERKKRLRAHWKDCKKYPPDYYEQAEISYNRLTPAHAKSWDAYYEKVHRKTGYVNVDDLLASDRAGCFFCLSIFNPHNLHNWLQENIDDPGVILCPYCGIDSILTSNMGYPVTKAFLANLHLWGFGTLRPNNQPERKREFGYQAKRCHNESGKMHKQI